MNFIKNIFLTAAFFLVMTAAFPQARIQLIHNSADAAVQMVDVWLDQTLIIDNFKFRMAAPFMDAPAGIEFTIAVTSPESPDPGNPLWSQNYTLTEGGTYIMVLDGIISTSGYDPAIPFDIAVFPDGRETGSQPDVTDMLAHHGSTDTPTIDIYETGIGLGQLVDNLSYAGFDGYMELPINNYIFEVRDESGANIIKAYSASFLDLNLKGKAITLVASGFMDPGNNSGGPAFGLYVRLFEKTLVARHWAISAVWVFQC